ncbi:flagellar hook-associated protein FlgK [Anaeromicrobium sediminis]|uniref:Flagellar hook-associated protein 1 n=1 Tax=Anaeromicrobium sediminis TaxID=1478221 RepID=A0A267ML31_9FIRM|nr:flagellar hook-associated protein FlgK [Anaeromicrobium sediminis]PAB60122.1 flagellar hook-associated protein FlgK [Anaeromicrobium sediminis]
MASTFAGLAISANGLYASQSALYTTNSNISNADTPGYSRQVVNQTNGYAFSQGNVMIGTGPEVVSVDRMRDEYIDKKYWAENPSLGEWETKSNILLEIEGIFAEPSTSGINSVMSDFYSALEVLSTNPTGMAERALLLQTGTAMCETLNDTAQKLVDLQQQINNDINMKVNEINSIGDQIAKLNEQIYELELTGANANELRDERDLLVDELSKIIEIQAEEVKVGTLPNGQADTKFQITLNGHYLVNGSSSNKLETYNADTSSTGQPLYGIKWEDSDIVVDPKGGELKGCFDLRDGTGENSEYKGIPYYLEELDEFARTFAMAFNEGVYGDGVKYSEGHADGYGLDGSTGTRFFTYDNMSSDDFMASGSDMESAYDNITALNISVSSDVENDLNKIAASSKSGEEGNNENIKSIIDICNDTKMFNQGSADDYINSVLTTLGTENQHATGKMNNEANLVQQIEYTRLSVSSVSIDEEMSNMVRYQQTYEAAAKMIDVWKEIYEVTINEIGG